MIFFLFIFIIFVSLDSRNIIRAYEYERSCTPPEADLIKNCSVYSRRLDQITGHRWDQVDKIFLDSKTPLHIQSACDRLLACLEQIPCYEAQSKLNFYEKKCDKLEFRNNEMSSCISSVYQEIHYKNDSCTNDFDYFSLDMAIKNDSYVSGKSCFLKIAERHCSKKAIFWLEDNYDKKFLKLLTTPPNDRKCTSLHQELLGRQCEPGCVEQGKGPANCRKWRNCYGDIDCAAVELNMINEECDQRNYRNFDLTDCMKEFYGRVYQGKISCPVDYLSRNMTIKREAFRSGVFCFMNFVHNHCSKEVVAYFGSSSIEFLDALTTPSVAENPSCFSLRDQLITAECSVFETRLYEEVKANNNTKTLRATCEEMEECLNQSSYISAGNDLGDYKARCYNEATPRSEVKSCSAHQVFYMEGKCGKYVNDLYFLTGRGGKGEQYSKRVMDTCETITRCYDRIKCTKSQEQKICYDRKCEKLYFANQNMTSCIGSFFDIVYHRKWNCVKDFDYFSKDMKIRREAYTSGKSCLIDIAKKSCTASAIEYLNTNYDRFLEIMTTPSDERNCDSLHDELMTMQCDPVRDDMIRNLALTDTEIRLLHKVDLKGPEMCGKWKQCMIDYANYNATMLETIDEYCELLQGGKNSK